MLFEVHYYVAGGPNSMQRGAGSRRFTDTRDFVAWLAELTMAGYVITIDEVRDIT